MQTGPTRRGDSGPEVRAICACLVTTGDLSGETDTYTDEVEQAVRAFQQRRGLMVDGIAGPQTLRALDGARWQLGDRLLVHTPGHLMTGDDVQALQRRLLGLGFSCGRASRRSARQLSDRFGL